MLVSQPGDDSTTALEGFAAGDAGALAEIYARWSPLVYSVALRSLNTVDDAERVTQRVFTTAWSSRGTFDPARSGLAPWLVEIARAEIAEARPDGIQGADASAQLPADLAERLLLADGLSHLDDEPRRVLRMALYDHLSHDQIAERMGLPSSTVQSHLRTSLLELRSRLEVSSDAR